VIVLICSNHIGTGFLQTMILTTTASAITVVATVMTTMTIMGMMTTTMATEEVTDLDPVGVDVVDHPFPHL